MQSLNLLAAAGLIGSWLTVGCASNNPAAEPLSDKPVPVAANQATRVGQDVTLNVTAIQDSRCPANALCIRYGSAEVDITVTKGSDRQTGRLCLGECASAMKATDTTVVQIGGSRYRLVLTEVRPYPGTGLPDAKQEAVIRIFN